MYIKLSVVWFYVYVVVRVCDVGYIFRCDCVGVIFYFIDWVIEVVLEGM